MRDIGLYDSDTGQPLVAIKEIDVSDMQSWGDEAFLVYTEAKRGRIVQLQCGTMRLHYFYDEPASKRKIEEDGSRRGFPNMLAVVLENAPPPASVEKEEGRSGRTRSQ